MTARPASRLAWSLWAVSIAMASTALAMFVVTRSTRVPPTFGPRAFGALIGVTFATVGALVASRRHENPIGWIFLVVGVGGSFQEFCTQYAVYSLLYRPGSLPLGVWAAWVQNWIWIPNSGLGLTSLFLLFPNGRFSSPRMRIVLRLTVAVVALGTVGAMLAPGPMPDFLAARNPVGMRVGAGLWQALSGPGILALTILIVSAAVSLFRRRRGAVGDEREQLKWMSYASLLAVSGLALASFLATPLHAPILTYVALVSVFAIPVAAGIAILKYRLYDIDIVISKTVIVGAFAAFITVVYLVVVVGIGGAIKVRSNTFLSVVATAIVAVAFQPVRERVRRLADRVVYGKRATPYEVLSAFAERLSEAYSTTDVLPRMAQIVAAGTGAERASVWLRVGVELREAATFGGADGRVLPMQGDSLPVFDASETSVPVRHKGELLGAVSIVMPTSEPVTPAQERLVGDVASQAGLVLSNVQLIEELRASRQRLVAAQDEERRKIERNIHDGAQQQLVALSVKLGLLEGLAEADPGRVRTMAAEMKASTNEALEDLRDLARGIYPPLLADKGLAAALEAQARKSSMRVLLDGEGIGRYPAEVEAAVYFSCLAAGNQVP